MSKTDVVGSIVFGPDKATQLKLVARPLATSKFLGPSKMVVCHADNCTHNSGGRCSLLTVDLGVTGRCSNISPTEIPEIENAGENER